VTVLKRRRRKGTCGAVLLEGLGCHEHPFTKRRLLIGLNSDGEEGSSGAATATRGYTGGGAGATGTAKGTTTGAGGATEREREVKRRAVAANRMDPDCERVLRELFHSQSEWNIAGYANPRVDKLSRRSRPRW
jgi:hypothetical protein